MPKQPKRPTVSVGDLIPRCTDMDATTFGAFTRILFFVQTQGWLPIDHAILARIGGADPDQFDELWPLIEWRLTTTELAPIPPKTPQKPRRGP